MKIEIDWFYIKEETDSDAIELLGIEPIPALKHYSENKDAFFKKCPAHTDFIKNTFVVCSPIDYEIEINKEQQWINVIKPKDLPKNFLHPRFNDEGDSPYPLFSLLFGNMMFISRKHDVWMEQCDPFLEWERKNKIRIVPGKFNIRRWVRPVECAFEQQEKNMMVKIKRGEPLFYLRFSTNDPKDIIELKRIQSNPKDIADFRRNITVKNFFKNCSLDFLYKIRDNFSKYTK